MISKNTHFTIFSDTLSCLKSLHNMNIDIVMFFHVLPHCIYLRPRNIPSGISSQSLFSSLFTSSSKSSN